MTGKEIWDTAISKLREKYPSLYKYAKETDPYDKTEEKFYYKTRQTSLDEFLNNKKILFKSPSHSYWKNNPLPLPREVLDDLLELENEKFLVIRKEQNLPDINTEDINKKIANYCRKNFVILSLLGMQGVGKTTFLKKYIPKDLAICVDEESPQDDEDFGAYLALLRSFGEKIKDRRRCKKSTVFDEMVCLKKDREKDKNHGNEYFCFIFDGYFSTCLNRIDKRKYEKQESGACSKKELILYLAEVELPINNDFTLEEGVNLVLVINDEGKITSAYPLKKFYEIYNNY